MADRLTRGVSREPVNGQSSSPDNNVDTLFITKNVQEIKQVERQMRLDIERKKEELRQLVGERYHDMIEAADSVIQMNEDAKNVVSVLVDVLNQCRDLQQTHLLKGTGGQQAPPTVDATQSTSAQMKLIVYMQSKIWYYLEEQDHLSATMCFLIMRNASSRMRTLESVAWPTVMLQYTQKITSFKAIITKRCREYFKLTSLSIENEQAVANAFVSLLLLEGRDLDSVLSWFLEDRLVTIEKIFAEKVQSVKRTVVDILTILRNSLILLYRVILPGDVNNTTVFDSLVMKCLKKVTNMEAGYTQNFIPQELSARLPPHLLSYSPQLTVDGITNERIKELANEWIYKCVELTNEGLGNVLVHVSNLRSLASIRDTVHQLLSQSCLCINDDDNDIQSLLVSARIEWNNVCLAILGEPLCLYGMFLRQLLLGQAKEILSMQLKDFGDFIEDLLLKLVSGHRDNPDNFMQDSDLSHSLWSTRDERDPVGGSVGYETGMLNSLKMKAKGCTPQINFFCVSSSSKLQNIVDDLNSFMHTSESAANSEPLQHSITNEYPFDVRADTEPLLNVLEGLMSTTINSFVALIDKNGSQLASELKVAQSQIDNSQITHLQDRLLLLSRLCLCFIEFTPNIKHLVYLPTEGSPWKPRKFHKGPSSKGSSISNVIRSSDVTCVDLLLQKSDELLSIWSKNLAASFTRLFKLYVCSENESNALSGSTVWEEIAVSEESEAGVKMSTNIRLPAQASIYIVVIMYSLCQEITRVGGHFISRPILRDLVHEIYIGVTDHYMELFNGHSFSQDYVLQSLFNYRFLSAILWYPSNDQVAVKHSKLVDLLVSQIDPFDYDVYSPHMGRLLERQLQRSTVMFGLLLCLKDQFSVSSSSSVSTLSSQEKHIIVPLSSALPRIPTLPGSSNKTAHSKGIMEIDSQRLSSLEMPSFFNTATVLQHV